ncbi:MAG: hypothetical protein ACREX4_20055 [Gammaproteobacteria bacterium]
MPVHVACDQQVAHIAAEDEAGDGHADEHEDNEAGKEGSRLASQGKVRAEQERRGEPEREECEQQESEKVSQPVDKRNRSL